MPEYLFLVSIGPVQEFIASARKSRDLWYGSWMLSAISKAAARAIQAHGGDVKLIFPAPEDNAALERENTSNVANKLLALVTVAPTTLGIEVRAAVDRELSELAEGAFKSEWPANVRNAANQQVGELIEFFWAGIPLGSSYARSRRQVEAILAARKTTYDFQQPRFAEMIPKSSLDGLRESVIPETMYPGRNLSSPERQKMADALRKRYGAGVAERLSGVDLLKRLGKAGGGSFFPSTSAVAIRPMLEPLLKEHTANARHIWHDYIHTLEHELGANVDDERVNYEHPILGGFDGGMLFRSRLGELFIDPEKEHRAARALQTVYEAFGVQGEPLAYYALLLADGDRMGLTIGQQQTPDQHQELSRRLAQFASQARESVENSQGNLVYAGGDDVLAFVPLHTLLKCATDLHTRFAQTINPPDVAQFLDAEGNPPTLSVGVAICHHLEPLSDALKLVRDAEQIAKGLKRKDALAIILSKRSGADISIRGHWGEIDLRLQCFVDLHRLDAISDGAAFELQDLSERLRSRGIDSKQAKLADQAMGALARAEAERILRRKQPQRGRKQFLAEKTLSTILSAMQPSLASISAVANGLIIARILAQAEKAAGYPEPDARDEEKEL